MLMRAFLSSVVLLAGAQLPAGRKYPRLLSAARLVPVAGAGGSGKCIPALQGSCGFQPGKEGGSRTRVERSDSRDAAQCQFLRRTRSTGVYVLQGGTVSKGPCATGTGAG